MEKNCFAAFASWDDVLRHVGGGEPTYYRAPLNVHPVLVRMCVRGRRVRIFAREIDREADSFTADDGHLDRMLRRS